jgi:hypothetical protein
MAEFELIDADCGPHPPIRCTFSRWERDVLTRFPIALGERGPQGPVRVVVLINFETACNVP